MRFTTFDHDGHDYAPHVDVDAIDVNGRTVPVMTHLEFLGYLREAVDHDGNAEIDATALALGPDGTMTYFDADYGEHLTYRRHDDNGDDGQTRYVVDGIWEWQAYAGPCNNNNN